jgi:hypothetical protein
VPKRQNAFEAWPEFLPSEVAESVATGAVQEMQIQQAELSPIREEAIQIPRDQVVDGDKATDEFEAEIQAGWTPN